MVQLELARPRRGVAQLLVRQPEPQQARELREWIKARHYLASAPPGYVLALEILLRGQRIGGMLWGRPCARELDQQEVLCLDRLFCIDDTPPNVESQALGQARAIIRERYQRVRLLVSYSDPAQGHEGTIYAADGWARFGKTRNGSAGWLNRPGRKSLEAPTPKQRWVRSP